MAHPTYRDRTKKFLQLRAGFKADFVHGDDRSGSRDSHKTLLIKDDHTGNRQAPMSTITGGLPPVWMETLESVDSDIEQIEQQIAELKENHSLRQRVVFEDNKSKEFDQNIQEITRSITRLFQGCKRKLQKIAIEGNEQNQAGFEDRTVRYNVMRSRATTLQDWTKKFRMAQRNYLEAMKRKEKQSNKFGNFDDNESFNSIIPDLARIANDDFDDDQLHQMNMLEKRGSQRTREIIQIAKSVHELAEIFQELSVLIVEQGSILDRIDYNVEQTMDNLKSAQKHLTKAETHQKRSRTALCIIVLLALIIVAGFILIIRSV